LTIRAMKSLSHSRSIHSRRGILIGLGTFGTALLSAAVATRSTEARAPEHSSANNSPLADGGLTYTCPMHPEVVSDKPGRCPKCGMKLVPKSNGSVGA
jgi:hypothetical protein